MPLLMHMANIQGESQIEQGWIAIHSFSWGGSRSTALQTGGTYGRSSSFAAPQLRGVTVSREADSVSALLWREMVTGATAALKFKWLRTGPGGSAPVSYMEATFEDSKITSIAVGSGGDRPTETLEFAYASLEFRVINLADALSGAQDVLSYDVPSHVRA